MCFLATILCLLLTAPAYAVDRLKVTTPDPVTEAWRWTEFDRSSGLAGVVRDLYEDRDGNIWFATDQGVQRYDGYVWTTYTTKDGLAHNSVRTVTQTRDGAMWFGTFGGGISRFDGAAEPEEAWTTYTEEDGLGSNYMDHGGAFTEARDGTLWAGLRGPEDSTGARGGVARFDPSSLPPSRPQLRGAGRNRATAEDGSTSLGADRKPWTMVDLPGESPRPEVRVIRQATDGDFWISTDLGAFRFDGRDWTHYTEENGLATRWPQGILESKDGAIWLACGRGISRFDPSSASREGDERAWRHYTVEDGLPENTWINWLWQTWEGTIWASGWPGVLCRFDGKQWRAYSREEVPQLVGGTFGKTTRDGKVWIGGWGKGSALRFDPTSTRWTVFPVHNTRRVFSIGSEVWLGARGGVLRFDGQT